LLSNFCVKIFSQNSLIPIQILNGFLIFYCATWISEVFKAKTMIIIYYCDFLIQHCIVFI
jgi:hypothetical protein